MRNNNAVWMR